MKKNLLFLCVTLLVATIAQGAAQEPAPTPAPLTKTEINGLIKKAKDNIKMFNDFKKEWADNPDTVRDLDKQLIDEQAKLAKLQAQLKTAPAK